MKTVVLDKYKIGLGQPLTLIAGPCVIEGEEMIMKTAESLCKTCRDLPLQLIFKSSYQKANRTSVHGFSGIGLDRALNILEKVKKTFAVPILTDIHSPLEAPVVAEVADVLQIPAFLSRQTDLILAAARTGRIVNIKKGQFLAPEDMEKAAEKAASTGNLNIMLTERGSSFGYRNLIVDMRGLSIMAGTGLPVVYDATHSVQIPSGQGNSSGGNPEFIKPLARAALATGQVSGIFMEVHPKPAEALSDAASQLELASFPALIEQLIAVYALAMQLDR